MSLPNTLKAEVLTETINAFQAPSTFLTQMLYPRTSEVLLPTSTVRVDTITRGRVAAPFILVNGEAVAVPGREASGVSYETPNIRIKRQITPNEISTVYRAPGENVFVDRTSDIASQHFRRQVRDNIEDMSAMIQETIEWMVAQTLQGIVSYSVDDQEVFTLNLNRNGSNTITLTKTWDDFTYDNPTPLQDLIAAKRVLSAQGMPQPTDAICGKNAATALQLLLEKGLIPAITTTSGVTAGNGTLVNNFQENGGMYLGTIGGIRFWEYSRESKFADTSGTAPLIRDDYVELVSLSPITERRLYFGYIPDVDALLTGRYKGRIFSKAKPVWDPSGYQALAHSRPLPIPRMVDASISMKVV